MTAVTPYPLYVYAFWAMATLVSFRIASRLNDIESRGPSVALVPRLLILSAAFGALADPFYFLEFQFNACQQPWWLVMVVYVLGFLLLAQVGALACAYDVHQYADQLCSLWGKQLLRWLGMLLLVVNNVLTSLYATDVFHQPDGTYCVLQIPPSPASVGWDAFVAQQVSWLAWITGIPTMCWLFLRANGDMISWEPRRYHIALFLGVAVRGATLFSFLAQGFLWGAMLQDSWASYMGFVLRPSFVHGPNGRLVTHWHT